MNETLTSTLASSLEFLQGLARDGVRPEQARQRLHLLQGNSPSISVDLIWEEEAYDQSMHYDVLMHLAQAGTVSLSFCPDRAVPWPLRGVHRWDESVLLRVNRTVMRIDQAIGCLDFIWNEDRIMNRLINVCIIQEELEKNPLELSDAELQHAMDAFRRAHRLCKAEDTLRWMEGRGMTQNKFERLVADQAIVAKLRDKITAGQVDSYFEQHRADFDSACIARIDCLDRESAEQALSQIRSGEADFYEVAQHQAMAAAARSGEVSSHFFSVVYRAPDGAEWKSALFSAGREQVIGPVRDGDTYALVRVLVFAPACLDEPTRRTIQTMLFAEWLEEHRKTATIEWFWGTANQTSRTENPR